MAATRTSGDRRGVYLIGERPLCRHGMAQLIAAEPDLVVCGQAETTERAQPELLERGASVVVLDLAGPSLMAAEIVQALSVALPQLPMLVVAAETDPVHALRVLRAGAKGFITNHDGAEQFIQAVRTVADGQVHLSPVFSQQLITELARGSDPTLRTAIDRLTGREVEVLRLLGQGQSTRAIAMQLGLSAKTVETHRARIKEKLGIRTAPELMRFALQWTSSG